MEFFLVTNELHICLGQLIKRMPKHPKCVKLRDEAGSGNWVDMLVFLLS